MAHGARVVQGWRGRPRGIVLLGGVPLIRLIFGGRLRRWCRRSSVSLSTPRGPMWALFVGLALTIRCLNVSGILWYPCLTCGWFNSFVLVISARLLFFPIDLFHATCRETFVLQENVSISLYRRPSRSSELLGQVNGTGRLGPLSVSYVCPNKTGVEKMAPRGYSSVY